MKGPYDGRSLTYYFGNNRSGRDFEVMTTSLAKAIRAFRVGAMFPHQYSTKPIESHEIGPQGYTHTVYLGSHPGGVVPVYVLVNTDPTKPYSKDRVLVAEIPPEIEDPSTEFEPEMLIAAQAHLQLGAAALGLGEDTSTAIAPASAGTGLQTSHRRDLETRTLELQRQMAQLELAKRELNNQVALMRAELQRRMEQIWMIELFLGSHEEVKRLAEGTPAPPETKITVKQLVLCMDEELAIFDWFQNPERIGTFDWQDLDDFDKWLVEDPKHLDAIFPHPKGIVGLRVRRKTKDRSAAYDPLGAAGAFARLQEEQLDKMTYLLVRNGENLYRLWVDVQLFPRLFAAERDINPPSEHGWRPSDKDIEARMKQFFAGLLVVQGLIERSDLFHPLPAAGISVFKPSDQHYFNLVRDGEENLMLADDRNPFAHLTWHKYEEWLRNQLAVGVRVLWTGRESYGGDRDRLYERTGINSVSSWPARSEIYTICEHIPKSFFGGPWRFMYLPKDHVYRPDPHYRGFQRSADRTRRVGFRAHGDELIPVDFMSWRVIEFLLHDRNSRHEYGSFFITAFRWWKEKKAEGEHERPFVDLVLMQAGVDLDNEPERARCERLLRWWKLKVKEHRTLGTDEAKALRMILKAFKAGEDHENDPERHLTWRR